MSIKLLSEKHVRMFTTSDDFFFQIICQILCNCVWNNLKLVLIDNIEINGLIVIQTVDPLEVRNGSV